MVISCDSRAVNMEGLFDDYNKLFMYLLSAGNYEMRDPDITPANFPGECIGDSDLLLVHPDREIESDHAVEAIQQRKLRPATMIELLAFGALFPEQQERFSIAALGQVWQHPILGPCVGSLPRWSLERDLILYPCSMSWGGKCRFLAVSEPSSQAA